MPINCKLGWDVFFTNRVEYSGLTAHKTFQSSESVTNSLYYIHLCSFIDVSSDFGAAILIVANHKYVQMLVEDSMFIRCRSTGSYSHGGAVRYAGNYGQVSFNRVCAESCYTTTTSSGGNNGQFMYSIPGKGKMYQNSVHFSSFSKCGSTISGFNRGDDRQSTIYLYFGNQTVNSVNMSKNVCNQHSSIYFRGIYNASEDDDNSHFNYMKFSTIANNVDNLYENIYFSDGRKYFMENCNIISNSQYSADRGFIYIHGTIQINKCYFVGNTGYTNIFSAHNVPLIIIINLCTDRTEAINADNTVGVVHELTYTTLSHIAKNGCQQELPYTRIKQQMSCKVHNDRLLPFDGFWVPKLH